MARIDARKQRDGTVRYRARIRLRGFPEESRTFKTKTAAKEWAGGRESDLKRGFNLASKEASRRTLGEAIDRYIDSGEPMDKAGAYAIQGIGAALVERVEGSYTNVVGLDLAATLGLLRKHGLLE